MVDCVEFLDSYSDFRDGLLPAERRTGFEAHVRECSSCARYDRVVGGGVQVFRSLPAPSPSPDFQSRLLKRLHAVDLMAAGERGSGASIGVTLSICAALGAGAWIPALRGEAEPVRLPPIVAHAPYHEYSPLLLDAPPQSVLGVAPIFEPHSGFVRHSVMLGSPPASSTMLAYRPVNTFYSPR